MFERGREEAVVSRRLAAIEPVSATVPSSPVGICQTNSILTDPDGRWVAARQSAITAGLERRGQPAADIHRRRSRKLSGESERIGKPAWDETTPPGGRAFYI